MHRDFLLRVRKDRTAVSEIIGMVGMSHSPFATMLAPPGRPRRAAGSWPTPPGSPPRSPRWHRTRSWSSARITSTANFYDAMPPFVLGVAEAEAFGDFGSRRGPLPVASALAWSVRDGLAGDGFDIALSYALTVDHGIVQSYDMVRGPADLPLVPLVVNTAAPPLPSHAPLRGARPLARRGHQVPPMPGRVLVIASGGLSHWLPSNDPRDPAVPADRRAAMIHGRRDVRVVLRGPRVTGPRHGRRPGRPGSTPNGTPGSSSSWSPPTSTR